MMAMPSTTERQRRSNTFARQRDALILRLLEQHPATAGMLLDLQLFPSRTKAHLRLSRLQRRKLVQLLGTVSLKQGRPEHVYARGRWKSDNLVHEVQLTRLCLKLHADVIRRGRGEVDAFLRPDAELLISGRRYLLELDCGTKSVPAMVATRFAKYRSCPDLVLWVCPSSERMESLRRHAGMLRSIALFTTLDLALRNPHAPIWLDVDGGRAALPRGGNGGGNPQVSPRA